MLLLRINFGIFHVIFSLNKQGKLFTVQFSLGFVKTSSFSCNNVSYLYEVYFHNHLLRLHRFEEVEYICTRKYALRYIYIYEIIFIYNLFSTFRRLSAFSLQTVIRFANSFCFSNNFDYFNSSSPVHNEVPNETCCVEFSITFVSFTMVSESFKIYFRVFMTNIVFMCSSFSYDLV